MPTEWIQEVLQFLLIFEQMNMLLIHNYKNLFELLMTLCQPTYFRLDMKSHLKFIVSLGLIALTTFLISDNFVCQN